MHCYTEVMVLFQELVQTLPQTRAQELPAYTVGNCGMTAVMMCGRFSEWCHRQFPHRQASWYSVHISEKLRAKSRLPSKRLPIKSCFSYTS